MGKVLSPHPPPDSADSLSTGQTDQRESKPTEWVGMGANRVRALKDVQVLERREETPTLHTATWGGPRGLSQAFESRASPPAFLTEEHLWNRAG